MALKVTTDKSGKITGATDSSGSYSVSSSGVATKTSSTPTTAPKTTTSKTGGSTSGYADPSNPAITGRFMDGSGFDAQGNYYDPAGTKQEMTQVAGDKYTSNGVTYTAPSRSVAVKPPSVISSADGATMTQQNQATLDRYSTSGITAGTKVVAPTTTPKPGALDTTMGKPTDPKTGLVGNAALLSKQITDMQATSDSLMKTYQNTLANYAKTLDKNTNQLIDSIQSQFAVRKAAQEELNRATLGGLEVAGVRTGRMRYANEMQTNIMSSAEAAGIQKLAELDVQEKGLILQARMANDEKKFTLLDKSITALQENTKQKQATIFQLYQFSQQEEQIAMAKLRDAYDQMNSDRNYSLQVKQFELTRNNAARQFAIENGINDDFYLVGNTAIDTKTGEAVSLERYQELTGQVGKSEAETDFSKMRPLSASQEAKFQKDTTRAIVASLAEKYFDAGVLPTDSIETAQAKITRTSRIYAEQVRPPSSGGGGGGSISAATKAAMLGKAKDALAASRGKDQAYDPYTYLNLRQDYAAITGETASFDNAYAPGLTAKERVNLGLGKAPSMPNYLTVGGGGDYSWLTADED